MAWLRLAERLGSLAAQLLDDRPAQLSLSYAGSVLELLTSIHKAKPDDKSVGDAVVVALQAVLEKRPKLVDVPVRKSARFSVSFTVETYGAGPEAQPALALNLSVTGILIDVSAPLPVGQPLELHFPLGEPRPTVRVRGRVVRVAPPSHYGIEFTDVDAETAERLREFLDGLEQV